MGWECMSERRYSLLRAQEPALVVSLGRGHAREEHEDDEGEDGADDARVAPAVGGGVVHGGADDEDSPPHKDLARKVGVSAMRSGEVVSG